MKQVPEQQITPKLLKKIAPDVTEEKAVAKQVAAGKIKDMMDKALALAANAIGGTFSSRVKDVDTAMKKIVQKRIMEPSRGYGLEDVGDWWGGRIVVNSPKNYKDGEEQIYDMEKQGLVKIKKKQDVETGNYFGRHFDVILPNGLKGEIQLHTKLSEAESKANHEIRAQWGEEPTGIVKALRDKQAELIDHMHPDRAKALTHAIDTLTKIEGKPPDHITTAKLVKQASL